VSDERLEVTRAARLPTLAVAGTALVKRLTLLVDDGVVSHVWYPVFPPDTHAQDVLGFLRSGQPA
jgi:peroxiredoxin (alkyl hydroperoxide reductase subunit C)